MARIRKIYRNPGPRLRNYYIVDACFLVNKFIHKKFAPNKKEKLRIESCQKWWNEIDKQLKGKKARIYVPDICIAEAFKVLAKKYYDEKWFKTPNSYYNARIRLINTIQISPKILKKALNRNIGYHDISTSRDIVISVDRFYELFMKQGKRVQIADLVLVATAKYLMDFYDIPRELLHIVTLDRPLCEGTKKIGDLPSAYNPTLKSNDADLIFINRLPETASWSSRDNDTPFYKIGY